MASPVHSSSMIMAKLYTSADMDSEPICSTSGAMYATVPAAVRTARMRAQAVRMPFFRTRESHETEQVNCKSQQAK